jgi:hypothetical protein
MVISVGMVTPPYNPASAPRELGLLVPESNQKLPDVDKSLETPSET